jgi:hypothetical protein
VGHSCSESPVAAFPPAKAAHPPAVQAGVSTSARAARQALVVVVAAEQEVGAAASAIVAPLPAAGPSEDNLAALEKE